MWKQVLSAVALCGVSALAAGPSTSPGPSSAPASRPVEVRGPATAPSKIVAATVYQGSALVTREVAVPDGAGLMELVVTPLPEQTVDSSLYSEGADGLRILSTRFRTRAVQEDTREEVRTKKQQVKDLTQESEKITRKIAVNEQNLALLIKLENFTAATLQTMTEKGWLNGDATIGLSKFIMTSRDEASGNQVALQQQLAADAEKVEFLDRQLAELTAGAARTERDAIITLDKANPGAGATVRLNYLVGAATWEPQYKVHAGGENAGGEQDRKVHVEYLASITQQSGEDWGDADVSISTAEPMLNAAPPDLLALDVTIGAGPDVSAAPNSNPGERQMLNYADNISKSRALRKESQQQANGTNYDVAKAEINSAGALEQSNELLATERQKDDKSAADVQGPSVTFHLPTRYTLPSRADRQLIEVARLDLAPDFFYKAVPVLTPHVYRLARLTNDSGYVLLPGDATMYLGKDFVGRMNLPLVAIGESFTAGFGIDPQVQVQRTLVSKSGSVQGGNQVHTYDYRIRVSNFKNEKVAIQVWDRLPKAEQESVGVTLLSQNPELSGDAQYAREDRPKNLLRWDLTADKGASGEKAATIEYQFKLEYARGVAIGNFTATK